MKYFAISHSDSCNKYYIYCYYFWCVVCMSLFYSLPPSPPPPPPLSTGLSHPFLIRPQLCPCLTHSYIDSNSTEDVFYIICESPSSSNYQDRSYYDQPVQPSRLIPAFFLVLSFHLHDILLCLPQLTTYLIGAKTIKYDPCLTTIGSWVSAHFCTGPLPTLLL